MKRAITMVTTKPTTFRELLAWQLTKLKVIWLTRYIARRAAPGPPRSSRSLAPSRPPTRAPQSSRSRGRSTADRPAGVNYSAKLNLADDRSAQSFHLSA